MYSDFSKTFEEISQSIIMNKMEKYELSDIAKGLV